MFSDLETAVLAAMCGEYGTALYDLIASASVTGRENTGHGFYTNFAVDRALPSMPSTPRHLSGPDASMEGLGDGMTMGFILWLEDGYPDCVEGFQYADNTGNTVDLHQYDLTALSFTRLVLPLRSA